MKASWKLVFVCAYISLKIEEDSQGLVVKREREGKKKMRLYL